MNSMNVAVSDDRSWGRIQRDTAGGRRLHYDLQVIQQPERARACGSGPKSSADRRPVDPPPIVQLRILEGDSYENAKDITFDYNATFFLYVSLENARPIAHGRVQTPAATSPPVLTGMPVSGCAYLDRPDPAGYFLFPDLSVRHEGLYRLSFELYEQRKERRDFDPAESGESPNGEIHDHGEYFCHLMGIKSQNFTVWSAKKFPGLAESTALSRTIAEQGCRVRIRRDIRMRRRENKGSGEYEEKREEEYQRQHRTQSPAEIHHARSGSLSSMDRAPYSVGGPRRMSAVEYSHPPPPIAAAHPTRSMLSFGQGAHRTYPPPPASSTPVSPAHPPFSHGLPLAPAYGPSPNANHPYPAARPRSAEDDGRPSYAFSSTSVPSLPGSIQPVPTPCYPRATMSSTAVPPVEGESPHHKAVITERSPILSPRSSVASCNDSVGSLVRSIKRSLDENDETEKKPMCYKRAAGTVTTKDVDIYGDNLPVTPVSPEADVFECMKASSEEYSRKRIKSSA